MPKQVKDSEKVRVPGVNPDLGTKTETAPGAPPASPSMKQQLKSIKLQEDTAKSKQEEQIIDEQRRLEAEPLFREWVQNRKKGGMEAWNEWSTGMHEMFWDLVRLTKALNTLYGAAPLEIGPMATLALFIWNKGDELTKGGLSALAQEVRLQLDEMGLREIKLNKNTDYNVTVDENGKLNCTLSVDGIPCVHKDGEPNGLKQAFERGLHLYMRHKGWNYDEATQTVKNADGTAMNQAELNGVMSELQKMDVNGLNAYLESYHDLSLNPEYSSSRP